MKMFTILLKQKTMTVLVHIIKQHFQVNFVKNYCLYMHQQVQQSMTHLSELGQQLLRVKSLDLIVSARKFQKINVILLKAD